MITPEIVYEDNHVIVVYKEKGILSQKSDGNDYDILDIVKSYLKEKYNKPGNVYLGLVHRLDRNTSGLMVLAKTSKAAARLFKSIADSAFEKKYIAMVEGDIESENTLIDYLEKDEINLVARISKNGLKSILTFSKIGNTIVDGTLCSYVDVTLKTGRFHQIRAQLSNHGFPLYGDVKYNSNFKNDFDMPLEAYYLKFPHPVKDEMMEFTLIKKEGYFKDLK